MSSTVINSRHALQEVQIMPATGRLELSMVSYSSPLQIRVFKAEVQNLDLYKEGILQNYLLDAFSTSLQTVLLADPGTRLCIVLENRSDAPVTVHHICKRVA